MANKKTKIVILGSCVSRDIFNFTDNFEITAYYARSSFASLYAPVVKIDKYSTSLASPFQQKIVKADLKKEVSENIGLLDFDLLLVDFIDERFNLFMYNDNSVCTLSSEIINSGFNSDSEKGHIVVSGSEEFYLLWEKGWITFIKHLKFLNILDKLRIHKAFWSLKDEQNNDYLPNYTQENIIKANLFLSKLYQRAEEDINPSQIINAANDLCIGGANHKWGKSPFHYVDGYYISLSTLLKRESETIIHNSIHQKAYDPYAFNLPVYTYANINTALADGIIRNGIHHIHLGQGQYLDLCIQGLEYIDMDNNETSTLLVGLSGAVTSRKGKKAPFFSGLGIANSLQLPIVSVSDITLALDDELSIGWYAGNKDIPDFPVQLAKILDALSETLQAKLLLFGGSAGGFASLAIASFLKTEATLLVWNPQTAIEDYVPQFVEHYYNTAFPSESKSEKYFDKNKFKDCMEKYSIIHNIRKFKIPQNIQFLYLQNLTDWHLQKHAIPYLDNFELNRYGASSFIDKSSKKIFFLGEWGEGHAVPPYEMILYIMKHLISFNNVILTAWMLDNGINGVFEKPHKVLKLDSQDNSFPCHINTIVAQNTLTINCLLKDENYSENDLQYAFYLLRNGQKIDTRWYDEKNSSIFEIPKIDGKIEILCFIKDIFGTIKSLRVDI